MSKVKSINSMIEIEKLSKEYLIHRKWRLMESLEPDGIKVSNLGDDLDASCIHGNRSKAFEDILPEIMEIQQKIKEHNREIDVLVNLKNQILEQIDSIDNVNVKVKYLRDQVGFSLYEIAEILGYSYNYIKKLSAALGKCG